MPSKSGYIPTTFADFHNWFTKLNEYLVKKTSGSKPAWTHIPQKERDALNVACNEWKAVYEATLHSDSTFVPTKRRNAKKRAEQVIRPFVKRHIHYEEVTDEERNEIDVPNHSKSRSFKKRIDEAVDFTLVIDGLRKVHVHYKVLGAKGKAKPRNYDGVVIRWALLDAEPKSIEDLIHTATASRTPHTLLFSEGDRGKKLYVALAWKKGSLLGPWTNIQSTYVP
ncbi:MAG: hypothetical protein FWB99_01720 [Treponema sp.]|nr:hypothetical protein [Treponema sp.]